MYVAKAEAEKIRLIGEAEAHALEAIGISEAERMRMKAAVYKKYGEAAILNITLNALPKVSVTFYTLDCNIHYFANNNISLFTDCSRSGGAISKNGRNRASRWKRRD